MTNSPVARVTGAAAIAAFSLVGLLALTGCEERPYPQAAKSYEAPKPTPPAKLAGAPAPAPPPAPVRAYAPPPPPPPPVQTYTPPPPPRYDNSAIVGMAPIPNPGEPGSEGYYQGNRAKHASYAPPVRQPAYAPPAGEGYAASTPKKSYHKPAPPKAGPPAKPSYAKAPPPVKAYKPAPPPPPTYAKAPPPPAKAYKPAPPPPPTYAKAPPATPPAPKKPEAYAAKAAAAGAVAAVAAKDVKAAAVASADKAKAMAKDAKPVAVAAANKAKDAAKDAKTAATDKAKDAMAAMKPAAAPAPAAKPAAAAPATNNADRSTRLAALQSALTDAVSKGAVLKTPSRFTANTPADVTLTVPAGFYDTLKKEAEKNGLTDAAASVNMTAVLSGDGFSVTPDETQSVPLTVGQPTEFRWTVTAQPGAKGPLHADVGADLLGGGSDTLALGSVQKAGGFGPKLNSQIVGGILLVLIAGLVVAWLARGRGPSRPASARRASRAARSGARPLDMGTESGSH